MGSIFAVEGDERANPIIEEMVKSLEGTLFFIKEEKKPLYHLAAVIACNYFVTLLDTSLELFKKIDIDEEIGLEGLLRLVHGTISNIERLGVARALTGPVARGDIETLKGHIRAINNFAPELMSLYKAVGERTVKVAEKKGTIKADTAKRIKELFKLS